MARKNGWLRLGDRVGEALAVVGITDDRVSKWLGRPCSCRLRRAKLNQLSAWAERVLTGRSQAPDDELTDMTEDRR